MLIMVNQINDPLVDATVSETLLFWVLRPLILFLGLCLADRLIATLGETTLDKPIWLKPVLLVSLLGLIPLTCAEVFLEQHLPFRQEFLDDELWSVSPVLALLGEYATLATIVLPIHVLLWLIIDARSTPLAETTSTDLPQPEFLANYPDLRVEDIKALQAEEHYVRVHKASGSVLIQIRFRDAIEQMPDTLGLRVHRSWWAADRAVQSAQRGQRRWQLQLRDGIAVPVSDSYVADVRSKGWLQRRSSS